MHLLLFDNGFSIEVYVDRGDDTCEKKKIKSISVDLSATPKATPRLLGGPQSRRTQKYRHSRLTFRANYRSGVVAGRVVYLVFIIAAENGSL